jgi:hypothetical protein
LKDIKKESQLIKDLEETMQVKGFISDKEFEKLKRGEQI